MKAVIMSCSKRKLPGGNAQYQEPVLAGILGTREYDKLLCLRNELFIHLSLLPGPDSIGGDDPRGLEFRPAYERYDGNVYKAAGVREKLPDFNGHLFIVSALYGLLEAKDQIRNYDLCMKDKGPGGMFVFRWWKENGLHGFLEIALRNIRATEVHDLQGGDYKKAIGVFGPGAPYKLIQYEYPGMGSRSQYKRAEDLGKLF